MVRVFSVAGFAQPAGLPLAWTGGRDGLNRDTQLPQPPDVMADEAFLLPLVHRRCGSIFKRLLALQYLIGDQK